MSLVHLMGRAVLTRRRLWQHGHWKLNSLYYGPGSHVGICDEWALRIPELHMPTDTIPLAVIEKKYSVRVKKKSEWSEGFLAQTNGIVVFTDGSKVSVPVLDCILNTERLAKLLKS